MPSPFVQVKFIEEKPLGQLYEPDGVLGVGVGVGAVVGGVGVGVGAILYACFVAE